MRAYADRPVAPARRGAASVVASFKLCPNSAEANFQGGESTAFFWVADPDTETEHRRG